MYPDNVEFVRQRCQNIEPKKNKKIILEYKDQLFQKLVIQLYIL